MLYIATKVSDDCKRYLEKKNVDGDALVTYLQFGDGAKLSSHHVTTAHLDARVRCPSLYLVMLRSESPEIVTQLNSNLDIGVKGAR